uniref:DUF676 domain-containing protein n=1 Tax=Anisakis simplex TaxID=6269 RepID=A0A0M3KAQ9_ANISI
LTRVLFQPVVFVHGLGGKAADYASHRKYFIDHGYSSNELYATTYGDPSVDDIWNINISCDSFRQIHQFIRAVAEYTINTVDLVAYSGGALIARKAILGGKCPDSSSENVGSPLTSLKEMRAQQGHFEGQRTLAIYSTGDHTIGRRCCGTECASLRNASEVYVLGRIGHRSILYGTLQKQFEFISNSSSRIHEPTQKALKRRSLQLPANSTSDSELSGTFQNSTEVTTVTITSSASLPMSTTQSKPKIIKTLENDNNFDPTIPLIFAFIALIVFLFKFLSRCEFARLLLSFNKIKVDLRADLWDDFVMLSGEDNITRTQNIMAISDDYYLIDLGIGVPSKFDASVNC